MAVSHYNPSSHDSLRIDKFEDSCNFVNSVSIRYVLRYCNDTEPIALRLFGGIGCIRLESHGCCQDSITIYKNILVVKFQRTTPKLESLFK